MARVIAAIKLVDSHCARDGVSAKWWLMSGTATLTMVAAITEAIVPTITLSSIHQRRLGPTRARSASWLPASNCSGVMEGLDGSSGCVTREANTFRASQTCIA